MIRPAQVALIERARLHLAGKGYTDILARFPAPERVAELSPAGFDRLADLAAVSGFKDRRRPILSLATRQMLDEARQALGITDFAFTTSLKARGRTDLIEANGTDLLAFLVWLEPRGLDVGMFVARRRGITRKQVQLVHVARKQTGASDPDFSSWLQWVGGVNSVADLDGRGFDLIMACLEVNGFKRSRPEEAGRSAFGQRPGFASPAQVELIRALWREWSGEDDEDALNTWLERFHHVSSLRFATAAVAGRAITGLRAMKHRRSAPAAIESDHHAG